LSGGEELGWAIYLRSPLKPAVPVPGSSHAREHEQHHQDNGEKREKEGSHDDDQ
jgi:hypothetical protein